MNVLIDINHPAHVHLFKHVAWKLQEKGHTVLFTVRDKENAAYLLSTYGFNYKTIGKHSKSKLGKLWGLIKFNFKLLQVAREFKPDIFFSHGSIYASHVSWMLRKPNIAVEDTGNMEQIVLYRPFTEAILTSGSFKKRLGKNQLEYEGYHELAYLHPNLFTPDAAVLNDPGIEKGEPYIILRFVSWGASHDIGHHGISFENKIRAVNEFSKYGKVFISAEGELPPELEPNRIKIKPEQMHHVMAFATLLYGESATMASESAMLGVPAIYLDDTGRFYTRELEEKYGLVFNFTESIEDQEKSINKALELLKNPNLFNEMQKRREKMLSEKIDVASFFAWFIENYPESKKITTEKNLMSCNKNSY